MYRTIQLSLNLVSKKTALRKALIIGWHILGINLAHYSAYLLRFDGLIPEAHIRVFEVSLIPLIILCTLSFAIFHLYSGIWEFFNTYDVYRILGALTLAYLLYLPTIFVMLGKSFKGYPRSTCIISFILLAGWTFTSRMIIRRLKENHKPNNTKQISECGTILVGDMSAVDSLLRGISSSTQDIGKIVGIATNDEHRHNLTIRGIPITGNVSCVGKAAASSGAKTILILPPYTLPKDMNDIITNCEEANVTCEFRIIPSMVELAEGKIEFSNIRKVEFEDLLGRQTLTFDRQPVIDMIKNKNILVTGAGGSIGSELVRQIAHYKPSKLILLDNSEYNLYAIDMEIRNTTDCPNITPVTGAVGNKNLMRQIFKKHAINIVLHAAAYKHVNMMELNVPACIQNNTLGTACIADEAERAEVETFIMVSTDKAVRPTSIMGASKRLAEKILTERPPSKTTFVTVRFGNVLGSSGSVVPLFKKQIENGGPVTVTSDRATRFFMSIPEAVDLILQASTIGKDREIMVLEMGESIKIIDMAKRLIELSGLKAGEDIQIQITGLRPGEKEYEEIMTVDEDVVKTSSDKIWIMTNNKETQPHLVDIHALSDLIEKNDESNLRKEIAALIPEAMPDIAH